MQALFQLRASRRLGVLAYHAIHDASQFKEHLDYIRRAMAPVSLDEVIAAVRGGRLLPRRAVLVTFDDGDRTIVDTAMPLLRGLGIPAVAFVVAGVVDSADPFWWDEVTELLRNGGSIPGLITRSPEEAVRMLKRAPNRTRLAALSELRRTTASQPVLRRQLSAEELRVLESAGIEVGNHTLTHPCLSRCEIEEGDEEIGSAHARLSDALGHPPRAFAYPDGDWDPRVPPILKGLGYEAGFLFDHRLTNPRRDDPFQLSRLRIDSLAGIDRLRIVATGLHPTIHHLRGRN